MSMILHSAAETSVGWLKASIGKRLRPSFATAPQFHFGVRQLSEKPFDDGHLAFFGVFNGGI
ncbi:hypothetical protein [Candidatus Accumulibacter aalborgensis]|uniref:hypothetical protein n=1 Tax=Candidatus Accumulibacter aalborgensis TaxID=1860102 RepID=UPI0016444835|nr:hypothetical protein [Candidatus Accumulibacter aalborgensis]